MIFLLGDPGSELGGSHYLKVIHGRKAGLPPRLDFERERAVQDAVRALIQMGLVKSAHDCSEGGLAVAIAESCISGKKVLGAEIDFGDVAAVCDRRTNHTENGDAHRAPLQRLDVLLFNESQSRIVISVPKSNASAALSLLEWRGVPARKLGVVGGSELKIRANGENLSWSAADLHRVWYSAISDCMSAD